MHSVQLVTEVGSEQEPTLVSTNQSCSHFPERRKKTTIKKTDWSPAKPHFFENLFPNNRLSFGPAWSAWAGLISNNPPAACRFLITGLLDDLLLIYRHKFPCASELGTALHLNGLLGTCLTCSKLTVKHEESLKCIITHTGIRKTFEKCIHIKFSAFG